MNSKEKNKILPSPVEFINKSYEDFTLFDLQDALIAFSKSISETKTKLTALIPKNFVRLIACKSTLENMKIKNEYSEKTINELVSKIEELLNENVIEDDQNDSDDELERQREILKSNMLNFSLFVEKLNEIKKMKGYSRDKFRNETREFLSTVYERIIRERFEEACELADIYFSVFDEHDSRGNNDCNNNNTSNNTSSIGNKIVNTLFINFKENTYSKMNPSEEYYSYLFKSMLKIMNYISINEKEDAINHVFNCLSTVLIKCEMKYCLSVFRRIEDFENTISKTDFDSNSLKEFKNGFSNLKIDIFKNFISKMNLKECVETFKSFLSQLNQPETKEAQEILLKKTLKEILKNEKQGFEYFESEMDEIKEVIPCLGSKESKNVKQLERSLRERRNVEMKKIVEDFTSTVGENENRDEMDKNENRDEMDKNGVDRNVEHRNKIDKNDDVKILMKALKIFNSCKNHSTQILNQCREIILKKPVILYFLHSILKVEAPILSENEKKIVEKLEFQFGQLKDF